MVSHYFVISLALSIFLALIFSPSEAITIFYQGFYLVLVFVYVILAAVIVIPTAILYVIFSTVFSILNDILNLNLSSQFMLVVQSEGLRGVTSLYEGFLSFLVDLSRTNASLFDLEIRINNGQSVMDAFDISLISLQNLFSNVWDGITEPVQTWVDKFMEEWGVN